VGRTPRIAAGEDGWESGPATLGRPWGNTTTNGLSTVGGPCVITTARQDRSGINQTWMSAKSSARARVAQARVTRARLLADDSELFYDEGECQSVGDRLALIEPRRRGPTPRSTALSAGQGVNWYRAYLRVAATRPPKERMRAAKWRPATRPPQGSSCRRGVFEGTGGSLSFTDPGISGGAPFGEAPRADGPSRRRSSKRAEKRKVSGGSTAHTWGQHTLF